VRYDRFSPLFNEYSKNLTEPLRPLRAYECIYGADAETIKGIAYHFEGNDVRVSKEVEDLNCAIDVWRRSHASMARPQVQCSFTDSGVLIKDTRTVAQSVWLELGPEEAQLLAAFAEPKAISRALRCCASETRERCLRSLIKKNLIIVDGERAVSIVVPNGQLVHSSECYNDFPGGFVESGPTSRGASDGVLY